MRGSEARQCSEFSNFVTCGWARWRATSSATYYCLNALTSTYLQRTGSVFSLRDGTTSLVHALLNSSRAINLVSSRVTAISLDLGGSFQVTHQTAPAALVRAGSRRLGDFGGLNRRDQAAYDAVVIAAPLEVASDLRLINAGSPMNMSRPYQTTHVTFVLGEVDGRYFGEYSARSPTPDDVMTTEESTEESTEEFAEKFAEGAPFTALQAEATLTNGSRVFKLFSRQKVRGIVVVMLS